MGKDKIIIINFGKRWIVERILAAIFFTSCCYIIFLFFKNVSIEFTEDYFIRLIKIISALIFVFTLGLMYSITKHHNFNLEKNYIELIG